MLLLENPETFGFGGCIQYFNSMYVCFCLCCLSHFIFKAWINCLVSEPCHLNEAVCDILLMLHKIKEQQTFTRYSICMARCRGSAQDEPGLRRWASVKHWCSIWSYNCLSLKHHSHFHSPAWQTISTYIALCIVCVCVLRAQDIKWKHQTPLKDFSK